MSAGKPKSKPIRRQIQSSAQLDQLIESEQHLSMLGSLEPWPDPFSFSRLESWLVEEGGLPRANVNTAIETVKSQLHHLEVDKPDPVLILAWVNAHLRQQGIDTHALETRAFEIPLKSVEHNIYHPSGFATGSEQNPEATSLVIAERIKAQYARRQVYKQDAVDAHDRGELDLTSLGHVDQPHDIFITLDYIKRAGLPPTSWAPQSGPARHANVLLAHMIRFTRELQNHFCGDVRWGFVNTLILPYLKDMSDHELEQFLQQMLFEFAQLDAGRGGRSHHVILDMDLSMPRVLADLNAMGPGGITLSLPYREWESVLERFNEILLTILQHGDFKRVPFHSPQIVFHMDKRRLSWTPLTQRLFQVAMEQGNPTIAFSHLDRDFGACGRWPVNHPDLLSLLRNPSSMRGFSTSSIAINLPRLLMKKSAAEFDAKLNAVLEKIVAAHRQKRLFLSRLMAFGRRGPLRFLRHKSLGEAFVTMDAATQMIQVVGLQEAASLKIGSPKPEPTALAREAKEIVSALREKLHAITKETKIKLLLAGAKEDLASYRLAKEDIHVFGSSFAPFLYKRPQQSEPFYSAGPNILAYENSSWRQRLELEGPLHPYFDTACELMFSMHTSHIEDPTLGQNIAQVALQSGVRHVRFCPDFKFCHDCFMVFQEQHHEPSCPQCGGVSIEEYGYAPSGYAPVTCWNWGRRTEYALRHRLEDDAQADQAQLPLI